MQKACRKGMSIIATNFVSYFKRRVNIQTYKNKYNTDQLQRKLHTLQMEP